MKSFFKQKFLGWIIFWLGIVISLAWVWIIYSSWSWYSDLPTVNSWSWLSSTAWNNLIAMVNKSIKQDSEIITVDNANWRIGIWTSNPTAKLDVNGTIKSTMWKTTQVFNNQVWPLPISSSFISNWWTLIIFLWWSWRSGIAGSSIGVNLLIDWVIKWYSKSHTNEAGSHKAFVLNPLVITWIWPWTHTIQITSWNSTSTDSNDYFNATVLELPF